MTLRKPKHFTIRVVLYLFPLTLLWMSGLALVRWLPAKFYSVHSQEQKGKEQKNQKDRGLRLETRRVKMASFATDKQGKPTRNLKREDSELSGMVKNRKSRISPSARRCNRQNGWRSRRKSRLK